MNKITNLKDLPSIWKDRQSITTVTKPENFLTKEQIDGSSMTTNPDQKFRKARIITEADMTKYKRPNKIKEMLNYCKFRLGELATCSKPSPMTLNVLYNYKSGKVDKIPLGYMEAIKDYRDLVDSAMAIDMRHKAVKEAGASKVKSIDTDNQVIVYGIKLTTHKNKKQTIDYAKGFISWLSSIELNRPKVIEETNKYTKQVCSYLRNKKSKCINPATKQILKQMPWLLDNYVVVQQDKRLILELSSTSKYAQQDAISTIKAIEQLKEPVTNDKPLVETINPETTVEQFIAKLKQLGVTEFSIKF